MQSRQPEQNTWTNFHAEILQGKKREYKIKTKEVLLRTQLYTIYKGLSRWNKNDGQKSSKITIQTVTIKKYHKKPNETQFFQNNKQALFHEKSGLIQFFEDKQIYFLILNSSHGTMYDKMCYGIRELKQSSKQLPYFIRIAYIAQFINSFIDLLRFYQDKKVIFNGLRPFHILYKEENSDKPPKELAKDTKCAHYRKYSYYFHDFTNATINDPKKIKKEQMVFQVKDYAYIPPQCLETSKGKEKALSGATDIWSFGCILYQIINCGQKMIPNYEFHDKHPSQKQNHVSKRLLELGYSLYMKTFNSGKQYRFRHGNKIMTIIQTSLKVSPNQRIKFDAIQNFMIQIFNEQSKKEQSPVNTFIQKAAFYQHKIVADLSIEIFRLNQLYYSIMTIFQELYFRENQLSLQKIHIYPIMKMVSCYFLQKFHSSKDKARSYARNQLTDKYSQIRKIPEEKRLLDIKQKAADKVKKQFQNFQDQFKEKQFRRKNLEKEVKQFEKQLQEFKKNKKEQNSIESKQYKQSLAFRVAKFEEKTKLLLQINNEITKLDRYLKMKKIFYSKFPEIDDDKIMHPNFLIFKICQFYIDEICKIQNITIYLEIMSILVYSLDDSQFYDVLLEHKVEITDTLLQNNPQLPLCELLIDACSSIKAGIWKINITNPKKIQKKQSQKKSKQKKQGEMQRNNQKFEKQMKESMMKYLKRYKYINYQSNWVENLVK